MFSVYKEETFGAYVFADGTTFVSHSESTALAWSKRSERLGRLDTMPTSLNLRFTECIALGVDRMEGHEVEIESPTFIAKGVTGGIGKREIGLADARGKVILPKLPMESKRSFAVARDKDKGKEAKGDEARKEFFHGKYVFMLQRYGIICIYAKKVVLLSAGFFEKTKITPKL